MKVFICSTLHRSASTPKIHRSLTIPISGQLIGPARKRLRREQDNFFENKFMPQVPILMPQLGESIAEATIVDVKVKPGDEVLADQEIIEVETNKAVMGVTTPCPGKIQKIIAEPKQTYPIGAILGYLETSAEDAERFAKQAPSAPEAEVAEEIPSRADQEIAPAREREISAIGNGTGGLPVPAALKGAGFLSPRVRARMAELQLTNADLAGIAGTGSGNRVTIKDL